MYAYKLKLLPRQFECDGEVLPGQSSALRIPRTDPLGITYCLLDEAGELLLGTESEHDSESDAGGIWKPRWLSLISTMRVCFSFV